MLKKPCCFPWFSRTKPKIFDSEEVNSAKPEDYHLESPPTSRPSSGEPDTYAPDSPETDTRSHLAEEDLPSPELSPRISSPIKEHRDESSKDLLSPIDCDDSAILPNIPNDLPPQFKESFYFRDLCSRPKSFTRPLKLPDKIPEEKPLAPKKIEPSIEIILELLENTDGDNYFHTIARATNAISEEVRLSISSMPYDVSVQKSIRSILDTRYKKDPTKINTPNQAGLMPFDIVTLCDGDSCVAKWFTRHDAKHSTIFNNLSDDTKAKITQKILPKASGEAYLIRWPRNLATGRRPPAPIAPLSSKLSTYKAS